MKAFFLVNTISGGGAEKMVNNLAKGFTGFGISSYLILLQSEHDFPITVDDLHIRVLYRGPILSGISKFFKLPLLSKRLIEVLYECGYNPKTDLFSSHLPFSNYVAWLALVKDHFAVIHSTYSKLYSKSWLFPLISLIHSRKQLIFVSKGIQQDFAKNFRVNGIRAFQIYNPFDFEQIRKYSESMVEKVEGRFIIHLGRFSPEKRHDLLFEAFANLKDRKIKLVLLGDGELRPEILQKINSLGIEKRVLLMGWVDNPYPFLRQAKLSVLSSDFEGLPTVLIESLILGTPVVSTNCLSGPSEILTGVLSEFLVPLNDPERLAIKMDQALIDYPIIDEKAIEKFSMQNIINEYIKLKNRKN